MTIKTKCWILFLQRSNANIQTVDPVNLSGTVALFKDLGREEQAEEIVTSYVANRGGERDCWDLESLPFADMVTDESVRTAFSTKLARLTVPAGPVVTLKN